MLLYDILSSPEGSFVMLFTARRVRQKHSNNLISAYLIDD